MNCDLLLTWMTHVEHGPWASFRRSVEELSNGDADPMALCRSLRVMLSDLGFADFFIGGSQDWRVFPPVLGGLVGDGGGAALCGGRSPSLLEALEASSPAHGCRIQKVTDANCPTLIHVEGVETSISDAAADAGILFESSFARTLLRFLIPIPHQLEVAAEEATPMNWKVKSFDFETCSWVDQLQANSACEFSPTYGRPKYFLHRKRGHLMRIGKRESIYASAMLHGVRLARYDSVTATLSVPLFAPLPASFSRVACLCSGRPADVVDRRIVYQQVPEDIAAVLMVAAGQPHPIFGGATT